MSIVDIPSNESFYMPSNDAHVCFSFFFFASLSFPQFCFFSVVGEASLSTSISSNRTKL